MLQKYASILASTVYRARKVLTVNPCDICFTDYTQLSSDDFELASTLFVSQGV
jgi:hypothetical protein